MKDIQLCFHKIKERLLFKFSIVLLYGALSSNNLYRSVRQLCPSILGLTENPIILLKIIQFLYSCYGSHIIGIFHKWCNKKAPSRFSCTFLYFLVWCIRKSFQNCKKLWMTRIQSWIIYAKSPQLTVTQKTIEFRMKWCNKNFKLSQ